VEAQGPVGAKPDADARRDDDIGGFNLQPLAEDNRASGQVDPIMFPANPHGAGQPSGTATEEVGFGDGGAIAAHALEAAQRLERPDKNTTGAAFCLGDDIQAVVHPIDEVDVGVAGRAVDDLSPGRAPARDVSGQIVFAQVSLDFGDAAGAAVMDENLTEQETGQFDGRPQIEAARQDGQGKNLAQGDGVRPSC